MLISVSQDCGATHNTNESFRAALKAGHPGPAKEIDGLYVPTYDGSSLAA
jgi:hypothetical protein